MTARNRLAGVAAVSVATLCVGPAAYAQTVDCAVYPEACVDSGVVEDVPAVRSETAVESETAVQSGTQTGSAVSGRTTPTSLPFTGGELVLLSVAGLGALAAGTALVVVARRRDGATA